MAEAPELATRKDWQEVIALSLKRKSDVVKMFIGTGGMATSHTVTPLLVGESLRNFSSGNLQAAALFAAAATATYFAKTPFDVIGSRATEAMARSVRAELENLIKAEVKRRAPTNPVSEEDVMQFFAIYAPAIEFAIRNRPRLTLNTVLTISGAMLVSLALGGTVGGAAVLTAPIAALMIGGVITAQRAARKEQRIRVNENEHNRRFFKAIQALFSRNLSTAINLDRQPTDGKEWGPMVEKMIDEPIEKAAEDRAKASWEIFNARMTVNKILSGWTLPAFVVPLAASISGLTNLSSEQIAAIVMLAYNSNNGIKELVALAADNTRTGSDVRDVHKFLNSEDTAEGRAQERDNSPVIDNGASTLLKSYFPERTGARHGSVSLDPGEISTIRFVNVVHRGLEISFTWRNNGHGSLLWVVGASGGGKTTLLDLMQGVQKPDEGVILINDRDANVFKPRDRLNAWARLNQERSEFGKTFREAIGMGTDISDVDLCKWYEWAGFPMPNGRDWTEDPELMRLIPNLPIENFSSGGQKQRLHLVRTLHHAGNRPVLLDEPFTGVDPNTQDWLLSMISHRARTPVICVSHSVPSLSPQAEVIEIGQKHYSAGNGFAIVAHRRPFGETPEKWLNQREVVPVPLVTSGANPPTLRPIHSSIADLSREIGLSFHYVDSKSSLTERNVRTSIMIERETNDSTDLIPATEVSAALARHTSNRFRPIEVFLADLDRAATQLVSANAKRSDHSIKPSDIYVRAAGGSPLQQFLLRSGVLFWDSSKRVADFEL